MSHFKPLPPLEVLSKCFVYDPHTGIFRHKYYKSGRAVKDQLAGYVNNKGYIMLKIAGEHFAAHRVAWCMWYKEDPGIYQIDHIDKNRTNNVISNLRKVNNTENQWNRVPKYGWHRRGDRYYARITHHRKNIRLGGYGSAEEAFAAYTAAALRLRGEYVPLALRRSD